MPKQLAWGTTNESLATGDTHTYQRESSSSNVKRCPLTASSFGPRHGSVNLVFLSLSVVLIPSHGRLHLMCVHPLVFRGIPSSTNPPHPTLASDLPYRLSPSYLVMLPVIVCGRPPRPD